MQRVLVIRIGRLGDTILATPVIEVLQEACGADVLIDFATSAGASAFILDYGQTDQPGLSGRPPKHSMAYSSRKA